LKTKDLEQLKVTLPPIEKQKELVKFLELADKERELLLKLANEKKQLSQTILDTIIQQHKEAK
jgi:restriction endonuclease S subunit